MWIEKSTLEGMEYYYNQETEDVSWEKPDALKSPEELEADQGEWVWIPHPELVWQAARKVKTKEDGTHKFKTVEGDSVYLKVPDSNKKGYVMLKGAITNNRKQRVPVPLWKLNATSLKFNEEDLVGLDSLNEGLIGHNLRARYASDELYTWVGASRSVLVSVNPYKKLPLYTEEMIERYHTRPPNMHLAPHVYDIAHDAYNTLMFEKRDQAVLISGESGAGKTEATKQCLSFFAQVAGSESGVEQKILLCNPLLEAFGNAKTIRNINSSRFGKWIEIHFDKTKGTICGASITNYLLERSRVVFQQENERNFHVFYQMCADSEMAEKYGLSGPSAFRYLNQSSCIEVPEIDEAEELSLVKNAMNQLEFKPEEQEWIFQLTAGILHLGNVTFADKTEKNNVHGSTVDAQESLELAASYLNIPKDQLERVLCYRSIHAKKDKAVIPLKPTEARYACDSLAKGVYGKLFSWLVQRVNDSVQGEEGRFIGVLDIFGFEIFDNNSFEQLCINFANEKLQQDFNRNTFKEEEALYLAEDIQFDHIEFIDNQVVLDLIEGRPSGILPLLDDECIVPEGKDDKFMNKIEKMYKRHAKFQTDKHRKLESSLAFEIEHYAGVVKYNAAEFMAKNMDTVFNDMYKVMSASSSSLTKELFPELETRSPLRSVSNQFRRQLNDLMKVIQNADSRYIRCIKPNDNLQADSFNTARVLEQLRYSGVFEAVEIRKRGYPFRLSHKQFAYRYSCINRGHVYASRPEEDDDWVARCKEIMQVNKNDFSDVKIGNSKVLYRAPEYKLFTLLQHLALETLVPKMQSAIRAGFAREFKRRIARAEEGLQEALDVGNDIAMVTAAIDAVSDIIGSLASFWSYPPRNLLKAIALKEDLQKWVDVQAEMEKLVSVEDCNTVYQELKQVHENAVAIMHIKRTTRQVELFDKVVELLDNCILGKLDKAATAAWASKDHDAMKAVVAQADEHNHVTETIQNIRDEVAARDAIEAAAKKAVDTVDKVRMENTIAQAKEHDYDDVSDLVKKAKDLVALFAKEEAEFVKMEKDVANKLGDQRREIHRGIRIKELYYEEHGDEFVPLSKSGYLREEASYAKGAGAMTRTLVGGDKIMAGMMSFQAPVRMMGTIPNSLTMIPDERLEVSEQTPQSKAAVKEFKKEAKAVFKAILMYMGDKKHPTPDAQGNLVLQKGLSNENLRTEIYHQIIKQITNNPNSESKAKGFELLALCLSTFAPPSDFEDYLVMWIRKNAPGGEFRPYTSTLHNTQFSEEAPTVDISAIRSAFSSINGSRFSLPPGTEYTGPSDDVPEL